MKITKSKLRQIIKEELSKLAETDFGPFQASDAPEPAGSLGGYGSSADLYADPQEDLIDELKGEAPKLTRLGPGTGRTLKKTKELLMRLRWGEQSIHVDDGLRAIEQVPEDYLKDRREPGYKSGLNRFLHDEKPELMQTIHGAVMSIIMDFQL